MTARPPTYDSLRDLLDFNGASLWPTNEKMWERTPEPEVLFALRRADGFGATHVYFRRPEGQAIRPVAWLIDRTQPLGEDDADLTTLHRRVWSAGDVPLVFVFRATVVDVFHVLQGPRGDGAANPWEIIDVAADAADKLKHLSAHRLANGRLWETYEKAADLTFGGAASMALAQEVDACRRHLVESGLPDALVKRLLILLVLVQYLDERGVIPKSFFHQHSAGRANDFIELLREGRQAVIPFLEDLADPTRFNGKVFALEPRDKETFTDAHLQRFAELLEGMSEGGQLTFWRRYAFDALPVELISHLYEQFLPKQPGVVYTPPFLVQIILDEVLPLKDKTPADFKVLDPACGSGVFLVGAFRRLVQRWQLEHRRRPNVGELQALLRAHIFGVDVAREAVELTRFSLSVALCDFLLPDVIWNELHFDSLEQNLWAEDFFSKCEVWETDRPFHLVVGNPPFRSDLGPAGAATEARLVLENERTRVAHHLSAGEGKVPQLAKAADLTRPKVKEHLLALAAAGCARETAGGWIWTGDAAPPSTTRKLPDKQVALLFLETALRITCSGGHVALIQPAAPLLYNEQSREYRRALLGRWKFWQIVDLTALGRMLFRRGGQARRGGEPANNPGDTPVAVAFARTEPPDGRSLLHVTVRRTRIAEQRLGLEVDHYDLHPVAPRDALEDPYVWKANLMGGGRLPHLMKRLAQAPTLGEFLDDREAKGWVFQEGYIRGSEERIARWRALLAKAASEPLRQDEAEELADLEAAGYQEAEWLTGKNGVVSDNFTTQGLGALRQIQSLYFQWPRRRELFEPPVLLIKGMVEAETGMIPVYLSRTNIPFGDRVLGIHAPEEGLRELECLRDALSTRFAPFFLLATSSEALVGRSTSILSGGLRALPLAPDPPPLSELEWTLANDVLDWIAEGQRQGANAATLDPPSREELDQFGTWFCRVMGTVHPKVRVGGWHRRGDAILYTFWFGEQPDPASLGEPGGHDLEALLRAQIGPALYTRRVVRTFLGKNVLVLIKPDQRRYWLRSIAIRDADELFAYLIEKGV